MNINKIIMFSIILIKKILIIRPLFNKIFYVLNVLDYLLKVTNN